MTGEREGALKLALNAPPVEGKANAACVEFLGPTFEAAALLHYHSFGRDQSQESHSHRRMSGGT